MQQILLSFLSFFIFIFSITNAVFQTSVTPSGTYIYVYDASNGYNWTEALDYCETTIGTSLASIHSDEDYDELKNNRINEDTYTWIGLNDINNEANHNGSIGAGWEYTDGTPYDYVINWCCSEPSDGTGIQNCVYMRTTGGDDSFVDVWCDFSPQQWACNYGTREPTTAIPTSDPTTPSPYCDDWTGWLDHDDPSGNADTEQRESLIIHYGASAVCNGDLPSAVECQKKDDGTDYNDYVFSSTVVNHYCNAYKGFECYDGSDSGCVDFQVRFCCDPIDCEQKSNCHASGDPHIATFDDLYYHFMGVSSYDYITSCDPNDQSVDTGLPFTISAEHYDCGWTGSERRCIDDVYVTFYYDNGSTEKIVKLPRTGSPTLVEPALGPVSDGEHALDGSNSFTIDTSGNYNELNINYVDSSGNNLNVDITYQYSTLDIDMSNCFMERSCGLCGEFNGWLKDDFHIYDDSDGTFDYLSTNDVSTWPQYAEYDSWSRTHQFGDSWCNEYISGLSDNGIITCVESGNSSFNSECMNAAITYCEQAWTDYCGQCSDDVLTFDEFNQSCIFDSCGASLDLLQDYTYDEAVTNGYLYSAINTCEVLCRTPAPTLAPIVEVVNCNNEDKCYAWGDPHITTFDGLEHHYQGESSYDYVTSCDPNDHTIDTGLPFTITGDQVPCYTSRTCIKDVYITLYDPSNGNLKYIIKLDSSDPPTLVDPFVTPVSGYYGLGTWSIEITVGNPDIFDAYYIDSNGDTLHVQVRFSYSSYGTLYIYLSECFKSRSCGLCGEYDDTVSNDFVMYNDDKMTLEYLSTSYSTFTTNTYTFGDSWCNENISNISDYGLYTCNDTIVDPPPEECLKVGYTYCGDIWTDYCSVCDNAVDGVNFIDWFTGCSWDACAASDNNLDLYTYTDSINNGYFASPIEGCQALCPEPTPLPTEEPTMVTMVTCDETSNCNTWGDPHTTSFDGLYFHYQGYSAYDYVTSCDPNDRSVDTGLPFTVTGDHYECSTTRRCLNDVYITLYDANGDIAYIVKLDRNASPTFVSDGSSALGSTTITGLGTFTVRVNLSGVRILSIDYTNGSGETLSLTVRYSGSTLDIDMSNCFMDQSCGLCGEFDDDITNDFHIYDSGTMTYNYLSISGVNSIVTDSDAWDRTHEFGDSWCNVDITAISDNEVTICEPTNTTIVEPLSAKCAATAEELCGDVWNNYCSTNCVERADFSFLAWYDSCLFDSCAASNNNLDQYTYDEAYTNEFFGSSIEACDFFCPEPTSAPTLEPTYNCNDKGYCRSVGDPHMTTFDNLYYHYQGEASYDYVTSCNQNDYNIETGLPFKVTGEHSGSGSVRRVYYTFVSLYDTNGNLKYVIRLENGRLARYEVNTDNPTEEGDYILSGTTITIDTVLDWSFEIIASGSDIILKALFEDNFGKYRELKVSFRYQWLQIWMSRCFILQSCGLCGQYDDDSTNDFHIYNSDTMTYNYLNTSDVDDFWNMPNQAWINTHDFGDSWCNEEISALATTGITTCEATDLTVVVLPTTECLTQASTYCSEIWTDLCQDPDCDYTYDEWINDCLYDSCATSSNNLASYTLIQAFFNGYFDDAITTCTATCEVPTLAPTDMPTSNPTDSTKSPTNIPTNNPVSGCISVCDALNVPCSCDDPDDHCDQCESYGCNKCKDGYFKKGFEYPCTSCTDFFGSECLSCGDWQGCTSCDTGYTLEWSSVCGLGYCIAPSTPAPIGVGTPSPTFDSCPQECTTCDACELVQNCELFRSGVCHTCEYGYFKKSNNHVCISCKDTFGDACIECGDYNGCDVCQYGYTKTWDNNCGLNYCV